MDYSLLYSAGLPNINGTSIDGYFPSPSGKRSLNFINLNGYSYLEALSVLEAFSNPSTSQVSS
jgi:hypothetical protein